MEGSLMLLRDYIIRNNIKQFATVEIGCGTDLLNYENVIRLLCEIFFNCDVKIFMHLL